LEKKSYVVVVVVVVWLLKISAFGIPSQFSSE